MGLFPMCLSKYTHTNSKREKETREREEKGRRKRRRRKEIEDFRSPTTCHQKLKLEIEER